MKRVFLYLSLMVLVFSGCETLGDNTKKGAGIGALTGAAIGGIVGHQDGHGWEGALIGAAGGATIGGVAGNQVDKAQGNSRSDAEYISLEEIVSMAQSGVPASGIISEIERTGSSYQLTSETISYLKNNGVGDDVINHMLST